MNQIITNLQIAISQAEEESEVKTTPHFDDILFQALTYEP